PGAADAVQLHAFPTRRSSDLEATLASFAAVKAERVNEIKQVMRSNGVAVDAALEQHLEHDNFVMNFKHWQSQDPKIMLAFVKKGDRKSTRLNSSHVKISYAVF